MAIRDDFPEDDRFPLFLSEYADEPEQQDIGKAWDRAVISSRILKTGILVVAATGIAIGIALLSVGKSSRVLCERHDVARRHIGASASHRSVDANNSINRRCSGFAADCKRRAAG